MNRHEILDKLQAHKQTLAERFGVTGLALFGSYARGQATDSKLVDHWLRGLAVRGISITQ